MGLVWPQIRVGKLDLLGLHLPQDGVRRALCVEGDTRLSGYTSSMMLCRKMAKFIAILAALCCTVDAQAAGRRRSRKAAAQLYNPQDYLRAKSSVDAQVHSDPAPQLAQGPTIGQLTGVTCDTAQAQGAQQQVGANDKSCAPGDANCTSAVYRDSVAGGGRASVPSASELADQLLGLLRDNCRPLGSENKRGFSPAVEVSVAPSATADGAASKKSQVSAAIGINGTF